MDLIDYIDFDEGRDFPEDAEPVCEHLHVRVEDFEDVNDEYVTRYEEITCRDCGRELVENRQGDLEVRERRAA